MEMDSADITQRFGGTQVRDDGKGPMLVSHRQRLVVVSGPDRGLEHVFQGTRLSVGTSPKNDLILSDGTVSRRHCELVVRQDRYILRDLQSTNGTFVNGAAVLEAFLTPGVRFRIGDTEVLFEPKKKWNRISESPTPNFGGLSGVSAPMRRVFAMLSAVSRTDLSCILVGETGTGKELAARALHEQSTRGAGPFVVVDCGAVTSNLIEAELFGHEKGAFTGADRQRKGAFELADGGTIFLDEIGELPIQLQPKLLRVLERREVKRLGAGTPIEVDVRVIAATHRDLLEMIRGGTFREDLYYRLAEVVVSLPPLRERPEDIPTLAFGILAEQPSGAKRVDESAMRELVAWPWPGNVRELRNVLRRAAILASSSVVTSAELVSSVPGMLPTLPPHRMPFDVPNEHTDALALKDAREQWVAPKEREYLARLINRCNGDLDLASKRAGVHRKSLERLLRQHNLRPAIREDDEKLDEDIDVKA